MGNCPRTNAAMQHGAFNTKTCALHVRDTQACQAVLALLDCDRAMERLTVIVSSCGILKSCASHTPMPASSSAHISPELLAAHRPGGSIYVCIDALTSFVDHILDRLKSECTLVSGDSDHSVDAALLTDPRIVSLLASQNLVAWYARNLSARHTKLSPLPIGLDCHTMWEGRDIGGSLQQTRSRKSTPCLPHWRNRLNSVNDTSPPTTTGISRRHPIASNATRAWTRHYASAGRIDCPGYPLGAARRNACSC